MIPLEFETSSQREMAGGDHPILLLQQGPLACPTGLWVTLNSLSHVFCIHSQTDFMTLHHDHEMRLSNLEDILRKLTEKSEVFILSVFLLGGRTRGSACTETKRGHGGPAL